MKSSKIQRNNKYKIEVHQHHHQYNDPNQMHNIMSNLNMHSMPPEYYDLDDFDDCHKFWPGYYNYYDDVSTMAPSGNSLSWDSRSRISRNFADTASNAESTLSLFTDASEKAESCYNGLDIQGVTLSGGASQYSDIDFQNKNGKYDQAHMMQISRVQHDFPTIQQLKKYGEFTELNRKGPKMLTQTWLAMQDYAHTLLEEQYEKFKYNHNDENSDVDPTRFNRKEMLELLDRLKSTPMVSATIAAYRLIMIFQEIKLEDEEYKKALDERKVQERQARMRMDSLGGEKNGLNGGSSEYKADGDDINSDPPKMKSTAELAREELIRRDKQKEQEKIERDQVEEFIEASGGGIDWFLKIFDERFNFFGNEVTPIFRKFGLKLYRKAFNEELEKFKFKSTSMQVNSQFRVRIDLGEVVEMIFRLSEDPGAELTKPESAAQGPEPTVVTKTSSRDSVSVSELFNGKSYMILKKVHNYKKAAAEDGEVSIKEATEWEVEWESAADDTSDPCTSGETSTTTRNTVTKMKIIDGSVKITHVKKLNLGLDKLAPGPADSDFFELPRPMNVFVKNKFNTEAELFHATVPSDGPTTDSESQSTTKELIFTDFGISYLKNKLLESLQNFCVSMAMLISSNAVKKDYIPVLDIQDPVSSSESSRALIEFKEEDHESGFTVRNSSYEIKEGRLTNLKKVIIVPPDNHVSESEKKAIITKKDYEKQFTDLRKELNLTFGNKAGIGLEWSDLRRRLEGYTRKWEVIAKITKTDQRSSRNADHTLTKALKRLLEIDDSSSKESSDSSKLKDKQHKNGSKLGRFHSFLVYDNNFKDKMNYDPESVNDSTAATISVYDILKQLQSLGCQKSFGEEMEAKFEKGLSNSASGGVTNDLIHVKITRTQASLEFRMTESNWNELVKVSRKINFLEYKESSEKRTQFSDNDVNNIRRGMEAIREEKHSDLFRKNWTSIVMGYNKLFEIVYKKKTLESLAFSSSSTESRSQWNALDRESRKKLVQSYYYNQSDRHDSQKSQSHSTSSKSGLNSNFNKSSKSSHHHHHHHREPTRDVLNMDVLEYARFKNRSGLETEIKEYLQ